jgi:hypothetical protein
VGEREVWLYLFEEEATTVSFDFTDHIQQFATGLPAIPWEEGAREYARSLRKSDDDTWTYDLPYAEPEAWSPVGYLLRVLYQLTHGRISYFIDAETRQRKGGSYAFAATVPAMQIDQQRFEVRHPITLGEERFLFEWVTVIDTRLAMAQGGLYFTPCRALFAADQAWVARDSERRVPLPFLSYWTSVDFSNLLSALGEDGIPLLVETKRGYLPNRLAPRMWYEAPEAWPEADNLKRIAITSWETDLIIVEGSKRGDGVHLPGRDQDWMYLGYRVTKEDGRQEYVAMIPHFVVPSSKDNRKGIENSHKYLKSQTVAVDALDLVGLSRIAKENRLRHSADPVSWPAALDESQSVI